MSRYREPLLRAAFDLQSRIYNIVKQNFLIRYLQRGNPVEQDYACRNTMFVLAEYLGWIEILRRGVQFLDLGDVERNRSLVDRVEAITTVLLADRPYPDATFQVFRGQQRAIGELMMDPAAQARGCHIASASAMPRSSPNWSRNRASPAGSRHWRATCSR
jgi:hypothetical protein